MIRKLILAGVTLIALAAALWTWRPGDLKDILASGPLRSTTGFVEYPLPIQHTDRLFDIGVVDANGDGWLDIYTSNHHFRQVLLLADGKGGYRDVAKDWKLDQSSEFPLAELTFLAPKPDRPGIYVYWLGTEVIVRAHQLQQTGAWRGSMRIFSTVQIKGREGFKAEVQEKRSDAVTETLVSFEPTGDGMLVLNPGSQGLPLDFRFEGAVRPEQIFVGLGKVPPKATEFSLAMRDRHAMAWADFNGDGVLDVFINRGALGGALRAFPPQVSEAIRDELLISEAPGKFVDVAAKAGIDKLGCSGRHATWVDFDGDGLLDLFVNCYDRENVSGDYPKQLYRQQPKGVLREVAAGVALGLPDQQMGNLKWIDVDQDGDPDLLAYQDEGIVLYRNSGTTFVREVVAARDVDAEHKIARMTQSAAFYDGKLAVGDFDNDGQPDVFSSSRRGNLLLKNRNGKLEPVDLKSAGLPPTSMYATWVDYDNDGLLDLHLFPQGIFRQRTDGKFEATGVLAVDPDAYLAAIANWVDLDNDGGIDVMFALDENPNYKPWWQFKKPDRRHGRWKVVALRNQGHIGNHWLQLDLIGDIGNVQAVGATASLKTETSSLTRTVGEVEGSFFSQGHYRLYFGVGKNSQPGRLLIRWSDGTSQEIDSVKSDQRLSIKKQ